jgi:predicted CopG family antitoxin
VVRLKSIKVDEETYKLLLKLKYEHAMRGVKLTFGDLVKALLLKACRCHEAKKASGSVSESIGEEVKSEEASQTSFT